MSMRRNAKERIDHKRETRHRLSEGAGGIGPVACTRQKGRMLPQTPTHDVREKDDGQRVHRESVALLAYAVEYTAGINTVLPYRDDGEVLGGDTATDSERLPKRDRHNTELEHLYGFIWMCFKLELLYWRDRL